MSRLRVRSVQLGVLGVLTLAASAPVLGDEASCAALCQMQAAYCAAMKGTLVGDCYWIPEGDICNLNGCELQQYD